MRLARLNTGAGALAALLALVPGQALATGGASDDAPLPAVEAEAFLLLRTLRDPKAPGPEVVGPQLAELGTTLLDGLFRTLEQRSIPDPLDPEGQAQVLSEPQEQAVLGAITTLGRAAALPLWQERYVSPLDETALSPALQSLGAFGISRDLEILLELPMREPDGRLSRQVSASLEAAIAEILTRDPRAFLQLEGTWSGLPASWLDEVVRAVGHSRDSRGVDLLAQIFAWAPDQQRLIASQLPLLGPSSDPEANSELVSTLMPQLQSESKEDVQAIALAIAQLEDFSVIPDLILLLDDPRSGVAASASHALTMLSGETLTANSQTWSCWFEAERKWYAVERRKAVANLQSPQEEVVLGALREISRHRLERHELALEVSPALYSSDGEVRRMAVMVLSELNSRWAARDLLYALDDELEVVRTTAHAALVKITGQDFGPEPDGWESTSFPERPY